MSRISRTFQRNRSYQRHELNTLLSNRYEVPAKYGTWRLSCNLARRKIRQAEDTYRLRVVTIELPPLRAHKGDIAVLAEAILQMHAERLGRTARLNREAMTLIERCDWPGSVRELGIRRPGREPLEEE